MPTQLRIHLAAAGLLLLLVTVIALFWSYPKLLVYLLLIIVAVLAYGALYLILAAWMDPASKEEVPAPAPSTASQAPDTLPDVTVKSAPRPRKAKKKTTRKSKKKT